MPNAGAMAKSKQVTIIGGGIAGMSAAIAFAMRGVSTHLHEQASAITEVGAGLQISPNGFAVLDALGLADEIRAKGMPVQAVELIDGLSGRLVARLPMDTGPRPYLALHRADLIEILANRAKGLGAQLHLADHVTPDDVGRFDGLVVGADGLHSTLRPLLNETGAAEFTGQVAWRAVIRTDQKASQTVARVYMAPGQHVVTYDLRDGSYRNIVAVHEQTAWLDEGWSRQGEVPELKGLFGAMCSDVQRDLDRVMTVFQWGLFRHPIAKHWQDGQRLCLIGDAAHPTLPFLGQGANMALEDAWVLASMLDARGCPDGLAAFQDRRKPRVTRAINAANANARNYHLRNSVLRSVAHAGLGILSRLPGNPVSRRFDWLYGHDVTVRLP
jgi:salicylate hydroxylase